MTTHLTRHEQACQRLEALARASGIAHAKVAFEPNADTGHCCFNMVFYGRRGSTLVPWAYFLGYTEESARQKIATL